MYSIGKFIDLTGKKFGRLTVIKRVENDKWKKAQFLCKCDCNGNEKIYLGKNLRRGITTSCGCYNRELVAKLAKERNKKYNKYDLTGEYGIGFTTKGEEFYFDIEDYDKIKDYCWYYDPHGYVITKCEKIHIRQHRLIMSAEENEEVDHICHINHDNRKSELRLVDKGKNQINSILKSNNTSGHRGVHWHKQNSKWTAFITIDKKYIYLGSFNKLEDAIKARKDAEEKYHKEYAYEKSINKNIANKEVIN